jgi:hypothetical protein
VDAAGARFPLRVDPFLQQAKLTVNSQAELGTSVAVSADGKTAVVGGPRENPLIGAAWVFVRTGNTWSEQAKLTPTDNTGKEVNFGWRVALSGDGNTALIGGPGDNNPLGAAWVFTRSGSTWTQQGPKLTGTGQNTGGGGSEFGSSVALSADGNLALVGGDRDNHEAGAVWTFTRTGNIWTELGTKLTPTNEMGGGHFGESVALSPDGETALVGASGDDEVGAVWVFTRSGSEWVQGPKLTANDEVGQASFGEAVAISTNADTALISGPGDNHGYGAAWIFTHNGSVWAQQGQKLTGSGEIYVEGYGVGFGQGIALSGDGNTAFVGGGNDNHYGGAAWHFARSGSTWAQVGSKITPGESGTCFGSKVALSADGNTALFGGSCDNNYLGAVWVFASCTTLEATTTMLPNAARGMAYSAELAECGGVPPYKWKKVGTLPKGLKLSKTGVLAGLPSTKLAPGSYPISVRVIDSKKKGKDSATVTLALKVS